MLYTLNNNYVLRQELNDCYRLYNKKTLRSYTISYKLFFILEQFRKQSYSLEHLIEEFNVRNIDLSDFYHFIEKDEFFDLLVMANNFKGPFVKYKISKDLSSYTAYSPERVDFLITKHCNLACKHCFEGSSPSFEVKRISSSDTDRILSQFEAANIQTLKITGGEPLVRKNIESLIYKLKCINGIEEIYITTNGVLLHTIILTNALLLNKQRIDMIKKGHIQLGISLDGMTSDTHDFIRGKGAFDKLIRILKILSLEDIKFSITCTINKKNLCQIDEIIDYSLNELGAQTLFLNRLRPMGRMNQNTNIVLSEQENDNVYKLYLNQKGKYNKRIILADDSALKSNSHDNKIVCAAGNSLIAIDENFNVYPCIYGIDNPEYKMGNLIDQNLDVIWKSSKWNIFRGNLTLEDLTDCRNCKLHAVCVMKNCRLKPVYEGRSFTSSISYCNK